MPKSKEFTEKVQADLSEEEKKMVQEIRKMYEGISESHAVRILIKRGYEALTDKGKIKIK